MAIYAHLVCRLTKDPELKNVGDNEILNFSVATDHGYGEKKTTTFVNCSMWGSRGAKLKNMLNKGKQIVVHGEIFTRKYQTKEGEERTSLECRVSEIDLVGSKGDNNNISNSIPEDDAVPENPATNSVSGKGQANSPEMNDDIPFAQPVALDGIPW